MKLGELIENPENPSKATEEQLERLAGKLKRVPQGLTAMRIAYVTDKEPGKKMVISGNKRLRVLKKAYGEDGEVPDEWFQDGTCEEMVILKDAEFYSTCEHHFFPFFGHCSIGYIPGGKVIGISKLARLLDCFSRRMQIQERMTAQIADFLEKELGAKGVYVVCEGVHFCMTSRGVRKQDASMITSAVRGVFKEDPKARAEFLRLIGR